MIANFGQIEIPTDSGAVIFAERCGTGPAVLLLHGFPQTHLMWRAIAPALADSFTVVCADLPGYGRSTSAHPLSDHPHSKRSMAITLVQAMERCPNGSSAAVQRQ